MSAFPNKGKADEAARRAVCWAKSGSRCVLGALLLALGACASNPPSEQPMRSPSRDYPSPPAQTSDGEVVGVDRKPPEDTLQTGPTNDRLAPGWSVEDGTPKYDPEDRVGGHTDRGPASETHEHSDDEAEEEDEKSAR